MKMQPPTHHMHYMVTCLECRQEFEMCGLPCFIICPGCHIILTPRKDS